MVAATATPLDTFSPSQKRRFQAAQAEAKLTPDDGLAEWRDLLAYQIADDGDDPESLQMRRLANEPIIAAVDAEIDRRTRLVHTGAVRLSSRSRQYEAIDDLKHQIKSTVSMLDLFQAEQWWQIIPGRNESHGPCPVCGGKDRLVIKHCVPGWAWCRSCRWGPDVVGMAAHMWGLNLDRSDDLRRTIIRLAETFLISVGRAA